MAGGSEAIILSLTITVTLGFVLQPNRSTNVDLPPQLQFPELQFDLTNAIPLRAKRDNNYYATGNGGANGGQDGCDCCQQTSRCYDQQCCSQQQQQTGDCQQQQPSSCDYPQQQQMYGGGNKDLPSYQKQNTSVPAYKKQSANVPNYQKQNASVDARQLRQQQNNCYVCPCAPSYCQPIMPRQSCPCKTLPQPYACAPAMNFYSNPGSWNQNQQQWPPVYPIPVGQGCQLDQQNLCPFGDAYTQTYAGYPGFDTYPMTPAYIQALIKCAEKLTASGDYDQSAISDGGAATIAQRLVVMLMAAIVAMRGE